MNVRPKIALVLALVLVVLGCRQEPAFHSQFFSHVEVIGRRGAGAGELNKPRSVAIDREDNLYVVDMTGRVQRFSPKGDFISFWQMPQTDKGKPKGMCRDKDGNIVVLEPHYSRINYYTPSGVLVTQWGTHGTNTGELAFPRSVAVNSRGDIFVSEYGLTERVQCFAQVGRGLGAEPSAVAAGRDSVEPRSTNVNGSTESRPTMKFLRAIGHAGDGPGEFNRAEGLGIDARDRLYVADSCNHRIQIFSNDGEFITAFGRPGAAPGDFSYPYDVRVDAQGFQYVCEFGNSRIQIFDPQHRFVEMLGGPGAAPGKMSNPWAIALDSHGNLYVADAGNHRVLKFVRHTQTARQGRLASPKNYALPNTAEVGRGVPAEPLPEILVGSSRCDDRGRRSAPSLPFKVWTAKRLGLRQSSAALARSAGLQTGRLAPVANSSQVAGLETGATP